MSTDDATLIDYLEELAEGFGIEIRYEIITQDEDLPFVAGGLCLLKGGNWSNEKEIPWDPGDSRQIFVASSRELFMESV